MRLERNVGEVGGGKGFVMMLGEYNGKMRRNELETM